MSPLGIWNQWDASWYLGIAQHGYQLSAHGKSNLAFFPLFPLLLHCLAPAGLPGPAAGLLIANIAFLAALFYLYNLSRREWGITAARRATWIVALFPTSIFFFAPYTEPVFLLAATGALYHARRQQKTPAALWLAAALLTRSTGLILVLPALYLINRDPIRLRPAEDRPTHIAYVLDFAGTTTRCLDAVRRCCLILVPAALGWGVYLLYLALHHIPIDDLLSAQRGWHRSLTWPWMGFVASLQWAGEHGTQHVAWLIEDLLQLGATVCFLTLTIKAWPHLDVAMRLYCAGFWLLVLISPEWLDRYYAPFNSMDRFILVLFPLAGWAATRISGRMIRPLISAFTLAMLSAAAVHLSGGWVG